MEQKESRFDRIFKISFITSLLLIIILSVNASAVEYTETTGDSLLVFGVMTNKNLQNPKNYDITIIADLNYNRIADPTKFAQYVKQYYYSNWWDADKIGSLFSDVFLQNKFANFESLLNSDGTINTSNLGGINNSNELMPFYYQEIDGGFINTEDGTCWYQQRKPGTNGKKDSGLAKVSCGDLLEPKTRVGFYGLPFYFQKIELICDKNDLSKGYYTFTQENIKQEISLTRLTYPSITGPRVQLNGLQVPMGYIVPGFVRLEGMKSTPCYNMDTTSNMGFNILLRPNPLYRNTNPNLIGSDQWEYGDIITGFGTGYDSSQNFPWSMNISFNYTGNWWSYHLVNGSDFLNEFTFSMIPENAGEMNCLIYPNIISDNLKSAIVNGIPNFDTLLRDKQAELGLYANSVGDTLEYPIKYSELMRIDKFNSNTYINSHINTGDGITCTIEQPTYGPNLINGGNGGVGDIVKSLSVDLQRRNAIQLDLLDKKMETKRFIAKTIVPFFAIFIIIIFYVFQIALLGFLLFAFIPMFARYFIKGMKEVFDVSEAKKLLGGKK